MKEMDRCTAACEADASSKETEAESACADAGESAAQEQSQSSLQARARGTLRGSTIGALAVIGVVVGFAASAVSSVEEAPATPLQAIALGSQPALMLSAPELSSGGAQGPAPGTPLPAIWE